ncbi:MAG: glycerol kinase GlpK [Candidatus Bathyarchaeia archaeon]|nr:glycerol kinase GlpK [Candidatus Bathyarchaeota archaeon]
MNKKYILGIDQGTTGTKAVIFDENANQISLGYKEIPRIHPKPGWVEQDPELIWLATMDAVNEAFKKSKVNPNEVLAIGIADQGETVIIWDKTTGKPIYNAIVWQCRRTAKICEELKKNKEFSEEVRKKTGLAIDPYFSATKIKWILENVPNALEKAREGKLLFGTTDSWLIWKLTNGEAHVTDYATASRTMLLNIHSLKWDDEIIEQLNIPKNMLPELKSNSEIVAETNPKTFFNVRIPISGVIVDQQGALFGQCCFKPGMVKNTYGTGCFALMNTGETPVFSNHGLLTTIAWVVNKKVNYALDGGVYVAGAAVQWLRDGLKIIKDAKQTEDIVKSTSTTGDVFFVPAFVGLAAPYWDPYARGLIIGITEGTTLNHIVRATLESIAYQVYDVIECMKLDSKLELNILRVDGGAVNNSFLMQFQSDILGVPLEVPEVTETTALGAAFLAGLSVGFWSNLKDLEEKRRIKRVYTPKMEVKERLKLIQKWRKAVERAMKWAEE